MGIGDNSPTVALAPSPSVQSFTLTQLQRSTVLITAEPYHGSGVIFISNNKDYYVWTVAHVAEMARIEDTDEYDPLDLLLFNGSVATGYVAVVSEEEDIALLRLDYDEYDVASIDWLTEHRVSLGDSVYNVGCPRGGVASFTLTAGIVSFVGRLVETLPGITLSWDQVSTPILPGSSGSGVYLASNGRCIGLVSMGLGESFALIVPSWRVQRFAEANGYMDAFTR